MAQIRSFYYIRLANWSIRKVLKLCISGIGNSIGT